MIGRIDRNETQQEAARTIDLRSEFFVFIVITALIWPILTVGAVGGYGFLVWMSQLLLGPPGPPGT
jgi:nitrate reductase NapE